MKFATTVFLCMLAIASGGTTCKSKRMNIILSYSDGNNNTYTVRNQTLRYRPIQPIESSSGTYSGGEPAQIVLSEEELAQVQEYFEAAMNHTTSHTSMRRMMTGQIRVSDGKQTKSVILSPRAQVKTDLEAYLKELLSKKK